MSLRQRMGRRAMCQRAMGAMCAVVSAGLLMGAANGAWLRRVSVKDHARVNPLTRTAGGQQKAAAAGAQLFYNECAKCHGNDGGGLHGRPSVISDRIATATDGDLFWLMTNGNPWKGMPAWISMPEAQRWQLVAHLRAWNDAELKVSRDATETPGSLNGATR